MPRVLRSVERELVLKIKDFCECEKRNKEPIIPIECVRRRVAVMTGITERKVSKIAQEGAVAASTSTKISTPDNKEPQETKSKVKHLEGCVSPIPLSTRAKLLNEIVLKVKRFCEREKCNNKPLIPLQCVRSRVAAMIGISERTVSNITREGEVAASTSTRIRTPGRNRNRKRNINDFECFVLRRKIQEYYDLKKELPTIGRLLEEMRNEIGYKGSRTSLWRVIKEMGFYEKCHGDIPIDNDDDIYIIEVGERMSGNTDNTENSDSKKDIILRKCPLDDHAYVKKYTNVIKTLSNSMTDDR